MDVAGWLEAHPSLSFGLMLLIPAIIVVAWAIRDARRRLGGLHEIDDVLLDMFGVALTEAKAKAQAIELDFQWDSIMKEIAKDIVSIDARRYSGKDMKDRKEIARIGREVRKVASTDEATIPIYKQLASAMVNNGYGVDEKQLTEKRHIVVGWI